MVNLLPEHYRSDLRRLYRQNIAVVSLFLLFVATLIASVLLLPSYFVFSVKGGEIEAALESSRAGATFRDAENALLIVSDTNKKISYLKASATTSAEVILSRVVSHIAKNISLSGVSASAGRVIIRGEARDRAALIAFTNALKGDPIFSRVLSPISNLIVDKDIKFAVDAELAR